MLVVEAVEVVGDADRVDRNRVRGATLRGLGHDHGEVRQALDQIALLTLEVCGRIAGILRNAGDAAAAPEPAGPLAAEKTQKNPVYYVQYAHARIAGILRNAPTPPSNTLALDREELAPEEKELIKRLVEFPGIVEEAAERRGPHALPNYAIRVADDFHRFYHEHRVLESEAQDFRLALVRATQIVIALSLELVGVEAPERM